MAHSKRRQRLIAKQQQPPKRFTTRGQVQAHQKRVRDNALRQAQQQAQVIKSAGPKVDYDAAWARAKGHFNKGMGGAYLYHMSANDSDPQVRAVYGYIKELVKQQKFGNISPTNVGLAKEKRDIARNMPTAAEVKAGMSLPSGKDKLPTHFEVERQQSLPTNVRGKTPTERALKMSLPPSIRHKTVAEVRASQTFTQARKKSNQKALPSRAELFASAVRISKSNQYKGRLVVRFPNGKVGTISSKGRVVVGKNLAGKRYVFQDGVIITVDGKTTNSREEFEPFLTVTKAEQPKGFVAVKIKQFNDLQKRASTKSIRNKQSSIINELKLLGLTLGVVVVSGAVAIVTLPKTLWSLATNPGQLTKIPSAISRGGRRFGQLIITSPTEAFALIAGEVILLKGTGAGFRILGKVSVKTKNIVKPVLNKIDKTSFNVNGNVITLAGGTASTAEKLSRQVSRAGKKAVGVSAQAEGRLKLFRPKDPIRKPIPGQDLLSKKTLNLLKKFDKGKLSQSEAIKLDRIIRLETKGAGNLLERSFFADPAGRVRQSRLGVGSQKKASLIDILSGDFTFRTNKPQILVFDDIIVEKFPDSLKGVVRKLKAGKTLTQPEMDRLLTFQLKKSGKFKPIGAISKESEITLAPGEIIQKIKTVGHVLISGQRVPVVRARVIKSSGELKTLLDKIDANKITSAELKKLEKLLNRKTGFKNSLSRSGNSRPVARFPGIIGRRGRGTSRRPGTTRRAVGKRTVRRTPKRTVSRPPKRTPARTTARSPTRIPPRRTPARRSTARTITSPPKRIVRRPASPVKKTPIIPPRLKKKFKKRTLSKSVPVFYIRIKRRGRIQNLSPKPLKLSEAKDLLAWSIDKNLIRTGYFEPMGKAKIVTGLPKNIRGYFAKNKRKLRPYRIKVGKKKQLRNGFIEKRRYALDSRREKLQLRNARLKKARKKKAKPTKKKK